MKSFKTLLEDITEDFINIVDSIGITGDSVQYGDGYIFIDVSASQLEQLLPLMPDYIDYEIYDEVESESEDSMEDVEEASYDDVDSSEYTLVVYTDNAMTDDMMEEGAPRKKTVFRGGQKVIKWTCKAGEKFDGSTCVKMTSQEKMARRKAGMKAGLKRKGKKAKGMKMRRISMKKRKAAGL